MTESAQKNDGGAPIANLEYLRSEILMYGGTPRTLHTIGAKRLNLGFPVNTPLVLRLDKDAYGKKPFFS